jgi:FtsZ-interacting cell division protein ZipA
MSTLAVIAIVVAALIVLAIVVSAARKKGREREFAQVQTEAKHDDVQHHRERADERRTEAAIAEEKAKRARVEADLDEERARNRETELGDRS